MFKSNLVFVRHILDELNFIFENTRSIEATSFQMDPVLSRAVLRSLEIIGEASNKLDPEFQARYSNIEWRKISDTRNRLIHNYMGVDYDIVWSIITDKLPKLKQQLEFILQDQD